jgi:polyhydroxybutyrate depolymerase
MNEHWNDGRPAPAFPNAELIDDVGFVSRLITDCLLVEFQIDPTRVYATGFSNGGFFAHRVGWELSDKLAAIAPVAGTMDVNRAANFYPRGPVSVLDIHGTLDEIVKYEGGLVGTTGAKAISAPEVVAMWAKADGCNPVPVVEFNPDNFPGDRARTRHEIYTGGLAGTEVVLVTMEGLEHNWPQARTANLRPGQEGSRQNAAAMLIWNFFERHPKK